MPSSAIASIWASSGSPRPSERCPEHRCARTCASRRRNPRPLGRGGCQEHVKRDYTTAIAAVTGAAAELRAVTSERDALAARERVCPTMQEAEARALVRALQEIAASVGLGLEASPADVVSAVKSLAWSWR